MAAVDDLKPWDRQPGESSPAYDAFLVYRDLGNARSCAAVGRKLGKSTTLMDRWSGRWSWVERTEAWDSMPGQKLEEAYEEMAARIAEQHDRLATKLLNRLEENLDLLPQGADPSIKWSTAHTAAHRGHSFATDLSKPADAGKAAITKAIEDIVNKLVGDE